jgi:hypothetical protein
MNWKNEGTYDTISGRKFVDQYELRDEYRSFIDKILKSPEGYKYIEKMVLSDYYYSVFKNNIKHKKKSELFYLLNKSEFLIELADMNKPIYNKLLLKFYYPDGFNKPTLEKEEFLRLINKINTPWSTSSKLKECNYNEIISINNIKKTSNIAMVDSRNDEGSFMTKLERRKIYNQNVWLPIEHKLVSIDNVVPKLIQKK